MSEELDEYEIEEHREPFVVDSDEKAAWAMRKLAEAVHKIEENNAIVAKEKLRLQCWLDCVNTRLTNNAAYFDSVLIDYMRRERQASDRKSIKLPHGTVKSVATQEKIIVLDGFVEWAQANNRDDLLTFPLPRPNVSAIKTAGITNEFVEVVPSEINYSVKVSES